MMIGETLQLHRSNPTVEIPPAQWDAFTSVNPNHPSPHFLESLTALHRYLPSNESDSLSDDLDLHVDLFSCDEFRMYEFKVRRCARARSHDWTDCPFAHPGEKARRRDPLRYHYSGTACPDYRKGGCKKGDSCEFAHGVFECWLHPARYRTQPCKDGTACRRRVCFFAHTPEQLRVLPDYNPKETGPNSCEFDFESTPIKNRVGPFLSSPTSILASPPLSPPMDSPPLSPNRLHSMGDLVASMRGLHVGKSKIRLDRPVSFNMQKGSVFGSPRGFGFYSLPSTPAGGSGSGRGRLDFWDATYQEEPAMERVESGRDLRTKMYQKLCKENSLNQPAPDVDWISELVQ